MLSISDLDRYDKSGMYKVYDRWPQFAEGSYESEQEPIDFKNIDHIVFSGMGGSGTIGDIFSSILSKTNIHVSTVKGYVLPNTVDSNTLVIATSVSGDTMETLTILKDANKLDCKLVGFSSGGKMQQFCTKNNIEYRKMQFLHSPRASFPIILYSMLKVLNPIIPIKKEDILDSISKLKVLQKEISSSNLGKTNPSLELARWISDIPLIYYPHGLQAAAIRFKNSLQENVKSHAMVEDIIEACHNGIVAWEKKTSVKPILLEGQDDHIKTRERWIILKEYLQEKKIDYREILSVKGSVLSKIVHLIYMLDFSTLYRASMSKIDPSPVSSIDFIKKRLAANGM